MKGGEKIMKKLIIIGVLILALVCLGGCGGDITRFYFNLTGWSSANATFNNCIASLDTPEEICTYGMDNFFSDGDQIPPYSPYQQWLYEDGDCNDRSTFNVYAAHTHGYEVYQIHVEKTTAAGKKDAHALGVFVVNGKLDYSSHVSYYPIQASSFQTIVNHYLSRIGETLRWWRAMDYNLDKVSEYNITRAIEMHSPTPNPDYVGTFIGEEAKERGYGMNYNTTSVNKGNPASYSGAIRQVMLYAQSALGNVQVASFYTVGVNRLSTRDYETIGSVSAGYHEYDVNITVHAGDYIGIYYGGIAGYICRSNDGDGIWARGRDVIPCSDEEFTLIEDFVISLEGIVISPQ